MADKPPTRSPTRQRPGPDQSASLPLTDAAAALGISENALCLRIRRKQVDAHKRDGRWHVVVDKSPDESVTSPDHSVTTPVDQPETVAALRDTVAILQPDVDFLRRELETRTDELQRRDVLLREALGRIPALAQGETRIDPQEDSPERHQATEKTNPTPNTLQPQRSWWSRWLANRSNR